METKDIIKKRRLELGMTMKELSEKIGVSEGTISRWEAGRISNMKRDKVALLSKVLGIPLEVIMGWETDADHFGRFAEEYNKRNFPKGIEAASVRKYPVLGRVACGKPIIENEEYDVLSASNGIKADAVVIARGDSMTGARIYDGDIVFIRFQEEVENGEIAVVEIESNDTHDQEVTLKRFHRYGNDLIVLRAENPRYEDMVFQGAELSRLHILGKAVAFQSNIR